MISYKPFYDTLKSKNENQYSIMQKTNLSSSIMNRIKNDKYVSLETIEKLCLALQCNVNDIVNIF